MGTKQNPSKFDCYGKARPDEPTFTLLARDPFFAQLVSRWVLLNEKAGINLHKLDEARAIATEGAGYRKRLEAGTPAK